MPDFYVDSLDISPSEFVYACSELEIDELIAVLYEDGYITSESILKLKKNCIFFALIAQILEFYYDNV